ncbi:MAG: hypothetical protein AAFZ18_39155, partial [Myxococcota bacterium]
MSPRRASTGALSRGETRPESEDGGEANWATPGPLSLICRLAGETLGLRGVVLGVYGPRGFRVAAEHGLDDEARALILSALGVPPPAGVPLCTSSLELAPDRAALSVVLTDHAVEPLGVLVALDRAPRQRGTRGARTRREPRLSGPASPPQVGRSA